MEKAEGGVQGLVAEEKLGRLARGLVCIAAGGLVRAVAGGVAWLGGILVSRLACRRFVCRVGGGRLVQSHDLTPSRCVGGGGGSGGFPRGFTAGRCGRRGGSRGGECRGGGGGGGLCLARVLRQKHAQEVVDKHHEFHLVAGGQRLLGRQHHEIKHARKDLRIVHAVRKVRGCDLAAGPRLLEHLHRAVLDLRHKRLGAEGLLVVAFEELALVVERLVVVLLSYVAPCLVPLLAVLLQLLVLLAQALGQDGQHRLRVVVHMVDDLLRALAVHALNDAQVLHVHLIHDLEALDFVPRHALHLAQHLLHKAQRARVVLKVHVQLEPLVLALEKHLLVLVLLVAAPAIRVLAARGHADPRVVEHLVAEVGAARRAAVGVVGGQHSVAWAVPLVQRQVGLVQQHACHALLGQHFLFRHLRLAVG
mmetsp:Transcript_49771/g.125108  ORF Transcript_49771/g.125108 Transcript_49771/m.125108 type:complete len:420 (+) Transcript_49771:837-2096(+)